MNIIPDKRRIVGLVEQAADGRLCLPNFQRDFVWPRDQVADLLRSIVRGYFIGSLLLLRSDPQDPPFAPVFLRGASPNKSDPRPELLVLDGQQRLTSLLYALLAPDLSLKDSVQRRWFYFDLGLLVSDPENDEIIFDRAKRELDGLDRPEVQFERKMLPCTRLLNNADFHGWLDDFEDWIDRTRPDDRKTFRSVLRPKWIAAVNEFQNFEVPLVELPQVAESDNEAIGRVCAIFEKLNSTGVELTVYDLLTARLYRAGIRLHDLWKESCSEFARLNVWSNGKPDVHKFGVLILRTLALRRGLDPKPSILINLDPIGFEVDWRRAAAAMDRALEIVMHVGTDGFGVFHHKWLPGFGLLPILAALRAEIEENNLGDRERADLRRWYWCNVFLERYSSAVESKSRKDYVEMLTHWQYHSSEPSVFSEARVRIGAEGYSIRESASYASAVYSGIFCLLANRGARDWRRGESIQLQTLQDHHIFPAAYLRDRGVSRREINTIVNRTLISNETNNKIKASAPSNYLSRTDIFPSGPTSALLSPHFLSERSVELMESADEQTDSVSLISIYHEFLDARERTIVDEIRSVCGIKMALPPAQTAAPNGVSITL